MNYKNNIDIKTVTGFGDEWERFDQNNLSSDERKKIFNEYFAVFPWKLINNKSIGADIGCGSGRWALEIAHRVGKLYLIDASNNALNVARKNLKNYENISFHNASVSQLPINDNSLDFAYSLGVLHHVPKTFDAIKSISKKLKPGAPFLIYLYYSMDNKSCFYKFIWKLSEVFRFIISKMPMILRYLLSQVFAVFLYLPLAKLSKIIDKCGFVTTGIPLNFYKDKSFYVMRTDALDRFGTPLEQRFSKNEIFNMMKDAGFRDINFHDGHPYWCAVGIKI